MKLFRSMILGLSAMLMISLLISSSTAASVNNTSTVNHTVNNTLQNQSTNKTIIQPINTTHNNTTITNITPPIFIHKVKLGQEFNVTFNINPSTGEYWTANYNPKYLKLVKEKYKPNYPILIGSGGKEIFTFKALKIGITYIYFGIHGPPGTMQPMFILCYPVEIVR